MTTVNSTIKNGVTGLLVNLSYISKEAIEPVLITSSVSVYCDKRDSIMDASGIKNWINAYQERAQHEKTDFPVYEFISGFYKEHSDKYAMINMLCGYFFNGRTYPLSTKVEIIDKVIYSTLQVVYSNQETQTTVDAQVKLVGLLPKLSDLIPEVDMIALGYLEDNDTHTTDLALMLKNRLVAIHSNSQESVSVLIRKGNNLCMVDG